MKATKKKETKAVPAGTEDRKKALETALAKIEKDFGKGTIMKLGDNVHMNV